MVWGRRILAVLAGAVVWAVLWIGGTMLAQSLFPAQLNPTQPITHTGALLGLILYSVALSLLAGFVTAVVGKAQAVTAVWALAVLQLLLGIGFEASAWNLTPVWYHLVFLALIIPATVMGGRKRAARAFA